MKSDAVRVTTRTPFKELVGLIAGNGICAVPVVDRHGKLVGTVTEADLLRKQGMRPDPFSPRPLRRTYRARWARASGDCAGEVMSTRLVTVRPDATIVEAARLMDRYRCGLLPVIDESGELAGTVASRDLLRVFLRSDSDIRQEITREIRAALLPESAGKVTVDVANGVAVISGKVARKSMLPHVFALTLAVDGVVNVEGKLDYALDDTRQSPGRRQSVPGALA